MDESRNLSDERKEDGKIAAPPMTQVLYTPVIAMTPIFSPYVVFGVEPTRPERTFDTPSAKSER